MGLVGMRNVSSIYGMVAFLLLVILPLISFTPYFIQNSHTLTDFETKSMSSISESSGSANLTWTSRTQYVSQIVENNSVVAGDHVVLNATFPQSENITHCQMHIWDGFIFETTRPLLVNISDNWSGLPIDPGQFDWITITGFELGDAVTIICNFTNTDSDFMAWDGTLDVIEYTYANNLLDMAGGDKPEHDTFIWTSTNDTMRLGCLDYDGLPGNWTCYMEVGNHIKEDVLGPSIELDTYYFDNENQTYNIKVTGFTELNQSIEYLWENIEICNFFTPDVTIFTPITEDEVTFNFTWSCTDNNQGDVNYYELWLGHSESELYMLMARNLTQTWFFWNSSGWIGAENYVARLRAFSVDYSSSECKLYNPPTSYWPGDFSDTYTPPFQVEGSHSMPPNYYLVNAQIFTSTSYFFGSVGNIITIQLDFAYSVPSSVHFSVNNNRSPWFSGEFRPHSYSENFTINIDGLSMGVHEIGIAITEYSSVSYQTVLISVVESLTSVSSSTTITGGVLLDWRPLLRILAIGISTASTVIIIAVVVFSIRLRRGRTVEYVTPAQDVLELD